MKRVMKGNEAVAEAAIRSGLEFFCGYPITPQSELLEYMSWRIPEEGKIFVQAESEIGSSQMLTGASIAGARCMTATSGPGLSLMAEALACMSLGRLPCVLVDVQRAFNCITPAQMDYNFMTKGFGHGGQHGFVLAPSTVQEAADCTKLAFEKAYQYNVPAVVLMDGMLGQMMEAVELPEKAGELKPVSYPLPLGRETHPGKKAFYQSGYGGQYKGLVSESACEAACNDNAALYREWVETETRCEEYLMEDAEFAIISYGSAARICMDSVHLLREHGLKVGMIRPITVFPFPEKQIGALNGLKGVLCVEMAKPEQFARDVAQYLNREIPMRTYVRCGGNLPEPHEAAKIIQEMAEEV